MPESEVLPIQSEFTVSRFEKRRSALTNDYNSYREVHREIAENFRPRRGYYTGGEDRAGANGAKVDGRKRNQKVVNSSPLRSSKNAQSGLQAGVTSPSRPWKKVGPDRTEYLEFPGVKKFFADTDEAIDRVLAKSNFYQATHTAYADFVDQGPGCIQIDSHEEDVIRCIVHPIGSWYGATNADGKVDVFYRDYRPTGHELLDKFGEEALPGEIKSKIRDNPYVRFDLRNAIEPNPFFEEGKIGLGSFKYVSVWWLRGHQKEFIKTHGYHEFPVMVFRFYRGDLGDVYGSGPGWDGLGDAKQLQHQERVKLRALDKLVSPPLQGPTVLKKKGVSLIPGKMNYHDGPGKVESIFNLNLPLQYILEDIQSVEKRISETFFEDLFLMIAQTVQRQTTAREIEERHQEKLLMLGPVLESISDELLDPTIDRVIGIMRRSGKLPEAPADLAGVDFKVEYISILAQAQRAVQTVSIEQGVNFTAQLSQFIPEALDRLDADGTVDEYYERIGFPPEAVREVREASKIRESRAQQAQQQQMMEAAGSMAAVAKDAANLPQTEPNVLDQLLGGAAA